MQLIKLLSRPLAIDYEEGIVLHDKLLAFVRILTVLKCDNLAPFLEPDSPKQRYELIYILPWR